MVEEVREVPDRSVRTDRRREVSRIHREQRRRRFAFAIIGLLLLTVAGIIAAGYAIIFVFPPQQLVVRVNDVSYTRGDMVKLLRVRQRGQEAVGQPLNLGTDIFQALQLIVENEIISQAAPNLGITVTEDEVDLLVRVNMSPSLLDSVGKSEDQVEREFRERYVEFLNSAQITEDEYRQTLRRASLRERMRQFVGDSVPLVAEQVHVHRLIMSSGDEMDIMQVKYADAAGDATEPAPLAEAFKSVVREFSRDSAEGVRRGGDLGWTPFGILQDYDYVIFNLEVGELSVPVPNADNPQETFFFMVSEKAAARDLEPADRNELKTGALQDWLNEERQNHDIYAVFNSEIYDWMVEQLGITSAVTPTPQAGNPLLGF